MNVFTRAAAVIGVTVVSATVEAVVMSRVTHLVISVTVRRHVTHIHNTEAVVTDLPGLAVRVHQTLAGVVSQVTDGGGVLTVERITGASFCCKT